MGAAFLGLVGWTTMTLWNWLIPPIFGLIYISFWQALGLLALSRILFGGFHGSSHWQQKKRHWKQQMKDKWTNMSDDERADWRNKFEQHCGNRSWSSQNTKAQDVES
jgi:hypothetical protein